MKLFLRINSRCNQDCLFCSEHGKRIETGIEELRRIVTAFSREHGKGSISITGGEPTLDFDECLDVIKLSSKLGFEEIELQTNAVLLDDAGMARSFKEAGLDRALVSLHSYREDVSNKLTSSRDFRRTLRGIRNMLDCGIEVSISVVLNKLNLDHILLTVQRLKERFPRVNHFHFGFPAFQGNVLHNMWLVPSFSEVEQELKRTFEFCDREGIEKTCCGLPLCILGSHGSALQEQVFDFTTQEGGKYYSIDKAKAPQCAGCSLNERCPGVYPEYMSVFGKGELKPVVNAR